jgi:hypothetical protein
VIELSEEMVRTVMQRAQKAPPTAAVVFPTVLEEMS